MIADAQPMRIKPERTFIPFFNLFHEIAQAQHGIHEPPGLPFHGLHIIRSCGFLLALSAS